MVENFLTSRKEMDIQMQEVQLAPMRINQKCSC